MAAGAITETSFNILGEGTVLVYGKVATTGDWVVLDSVYPGTMGVMSGTQFPLDNPSEQIVPSFAKLIASAAVASTTTETFTYDGATGDQRTSGGYYIISDTSGEIMYVVSDSGYTTTTGTLVVKRGALGTTAVNIGDNDQFSVLNCIIITTATAVGPFMLEFRSLPADYGTAPFQ